MFRIDLRPIVLLCALALSASCAAPFHATAPDGFAPLEGNNPFRAVTADDVVYRVRTQDNRPRADLKFWKKALKQRMEDAGYVFVADRPIKANQTPGYLLELAAPFGPKDYGYIIALFVHGDQLTLVESSGELAKLRARRPALVSAIKRIRW